jgi:hypothetical protein
MSRTVQIVPSFLTFKSHRFSQSYRLQRYSKDIEKNVVGLRDQSIQKVATAGQELSKLWSWREESNLQPVVYKTDEAGTEATQQELQKEKMRI